MINEPVYVEITNVARWVREYADSTDKFPTLGHLAVPFNRAVFEWRDRWLENKKARADLWFMEREYHDPNWNHEGARWVMIIEVSLMDQPFGAVRAYMNGDGSIEKWQSGKIKQGLFAHRVDEKTLHNALFPTYFAISLLHCKNVELIDRPVTRQYRRLQERKGEPIIQYKTLVIEPFKKQVRNEAHASGENEIERALHICRGHFATYTEDAPLFGKHTGTFWRPMHVRGTAKEGTVVKDYKVTTDDRPS